MLEASYRVGTEVLFVARAHQLVRTPAFCNNTLSNFIYLGLVLIHYFWLSSLAPVFVCAFDSLTAGTEFWALTMPVQEAVR